MLSADDNSSNAIFKSSVPHGKTVILVVDSKNVSYPTRIINVELILINFCEYRKKLNKMHKYGCLKS